MLDKRGRQIERGDTVRFDAYFYPGDNRPDGTFEGKVVKIGKSYCEIACDHPEFCRMYEDAYLKEGLPAPQELTYIYEMGPDSIEVLDRKPQKAPEEQLQELYFHLDTADSNGNTYLAWYAQCRAKEMTHAEAIEDTLTHFHIRDRDWYKLRMARSNG